MRLARKCGADVSRALHSRHETRKECFSRGEGGERGEKRRRNPHKRPSQTVLFHLVDSTPLDSFAPPGVRPAMRRLSFRDGRGVLGLWQVCREAHAHTEDLKLARREKRALGVSRRSRKRGSHHRNRGL
eukprot:scaffold228_cov312-Pinguiococcus_pyrenoidosus.AAC.30